MLEWGGIRKYYNLLEVEPPTGLSFLEVQSQKSLASGNLQNQSVNQVGFCFGFLGMLCLVLIFAKLIGFLKLGLLEPFFIFCY